MKIRCIDPYGYGVRPSAAVLLRWQQCNKRNKRNRPFKLGLAALSSLLGRAQRFLSSIN